MSAGDFEPRPDSEVAHDHEQKVKAAVYNAAIVLNDAVIRQIVEETLRRARRDLSS